MRHPIQGTGRHLEAGIEVAHFGPEPLHNASALWKLAGDDAREAASGRLPAQDIPIGNGIALGKIRIPLRDIAAPQRYRLVVSLGEFENDWEVWIYPEQADLQPPGGVTIVAAFNGNVRAAL